ncbi:unnamed protein product [Chironomus riparius]|uniref:Uncharacterized protein n=1 Tax=Chironomus riparius TaxID=315576 RepID=A0A9N9RYX2_9DIPT|nr:unnamed protein product [Chironomus riparius]
MDNSNIILIRFTKEEVNSHTVSFNGAISLKHKGRGKKIIVDGDAQTEQEKEANKSKIPYDDNLHRKLTQASTPGSFFKVTDGFKANSKKMIREYQFNQVTKEMENHPELIPEIPETPKSSRTQSNQTRAESKMEHIFKSLEEVINIQLNRVKDRVLAVAAQDDKDPLELLKQNGEAFGANIGRLFAKCIESIDNEEDCETEEQEGTQNALTTEELQPKRKLSAVALVLQKKQRDNLAKNNRI